MITAIDTSVLLDVLGGDPEFGPASRDAMRAARQAGRLIAGEVVWAETAAAFDGAEDARAAFTALALEYVPTGAEAALAAARSWRDYRRDGGPRDRVIPDFLVAAHAAAYADCLLTRDRGFYRARFADLPLVDPAEHR